MNDKVYNDGVYDISNEEYHAAHAVSRSRLMLLDKSPYHFWYETLSGQSKPREATPAMVFGSAFHTLMLEKDKFNSEYCIKPELQKMPAELRLKDVGREAFEENKEIRKRIQETNKIISEEFETLHSGKIVLTIDQFSQLGKMVNLIKKHEIVTTLLDEAVFEQSIFWTDKETGLQFKARPDIWSSRMIVDLKTTKEASPFAFTRSALSNGYYLQAGMMFEACKAIGKPFEMFVILACEKEEPHVPAVFMMHEEALQFGIDQFNAYKKKLKICLETNKWDGYPVLELGIPKYATINEEE